MEFLKTMMGKVVTGLVALAVVVAGISFYEMDPATRTALFAGTGHLVAWTGIVLVLPWATFFVTGWIDRLESNLAGAALVAAYTVIEVLLLGKLFGWHHDATGWTFFAVGTLLAAVYNVLTCDWLAEKV